MYNAILSVTVSDLAGILRNFSHFSHILKLLFLVNYFVGTSDTLSVQYDITLSAYM